MKIAFRHCLGKGFVEPDGERYSAAMSLELAGTASGAIEEEALVWDQNATGTFRLLFENRRWDGGIDLDLPGHFFWDETTLAREVKPFIETRFEIRKRMYKHLPEFVKRLASQFSLDHAVSSLEQDIPF